MSRLRRIEWQAKPSEYLVEKSDCVDNGRGVRLFPIGSMIVGAKCGRDLQSGRSADRKEIIVSDARQRRQSRAGDQLRGELAVGLRRGDGIGVAQQDVDRDVDARETLGIYGLDQRWRKRK